MTEGRSLKALFPFGPASLECAVDIPRALRYLGRRRQEVPQHLGDQLAAVAGRCRDTARPRAMVSAAFPLRFCPAGAEGADVRGKGTGFSVTAGREGAGCGEALLEEARLRGVLLEGPGLMLPGGDIARFLEGCTHAVLLAVTLGMENERELLRARALGPVQELMTDACASSMAEEAARAASAEVERRAAEAGFRCTRRFSPGYGDLPLSLQPEMLRLTGADRMLGVQTAPSFLMTPMKSVTAVVGLVPEDGEGRRAGHGRTAHA